MNRNPKYICPNCGRTIEGWLNFMQHYQSQKCIHENIKEMSDETGNQH